MFKYPLMIFIILALFINTLQAIERRNSHRELQEQIALINKIEKDWLFINGYAFPLEHQGLRIRNSKHGLDGNVYFTMPATLMHYKTGHKYDASHQSVFDLLTQEKEKVILIHSGDQLTVDELNQYLLDRYKSAVRFAPIKKEGLKYPVYVNAPVDDF